MVVCGGGGGGAVSVLDVHQHVAFVGEARLHRTPIKRAIDLRARDEKRKANCCGRLVESGWG